MKKIKVGIIGTGAMGKSHVRVYSEIPNAEIVLICDRDEKISNELAKKYKAKSYTDYKEIQDDLDAVSICVPTKYHKEVALFFIKKRVHVLIEKPIAANVEEAEELIKAAEENKVKLMVGHIERFNPSLAELKKRLSNEELGKIYKVTSLRMSPFPYRILDVGVTIDLAIHEIDVMNYILRSKVKRLYAETSRRIHSSHEDLLVGNLKFSNDVIGVIECNWLTPKKIREISVIGEKGLLKTNYLTQELYFYKNKFTDKDLDYEKGFMNIVEGDMVKIKIDKKEPLRNELEAFIRCIVEDEKSPVSGRAGLEALKIAQKLIESSKKHEVIKL